MPLQKLTFAAVFFLFCLSLFFFLRADEGRQNVEEGSLSLYFKGEKVGYEVYTWQELERSYLLSVEGRLTKPVSVEIEHLAIEVDKNFIPVRYVFRGSMSGVRQEISSRLSDGLVENTIRVAGQEQRSQIQIRRDTVLLPNPFMSPYLVIGKRFGCGAEEMKDLSAYIIPQIEIPLSLASSEEDPCLLYLQIGETRIELEIDESGRLQRLRIPSQNMEAVDDFGSSGF